jgi:cell division protein FtsI/penicillin-binding protein 2
VPRWTWGCASGASAHGGILRTPHIVRAIDGKVQPQPAGHRIISQTTAAELRKMLEGVLGPEGTASEVSIPGYHLAGKTGTANKIDPETGEYSESKFMASFIGFGGRQRTAVGVDLRRHRRGSRFRADHELRAAIPGHRARIAAGSRWAPGP